MADQLSIWNVALAHLGERRVASLTEPREPARVLADEWVAAVRGCLQMAPWSFSTKTVQLASSGTGAGPFAYSVQKPVDWMRTADMAVDGLLTTPLEGYIEEGGFWYVPVPSICVRYVSADAQYGFLVDGWHQAFADLVALNLAARCCRRLTGDSSLLSDLVKLREGAHQDALAYEEQTVARNYPITGVANERRLQAYNDALAILGRARVVSLTQTTDTVRELNDQWLAAVRWCLEQAPWVFAVREGVFTPDPTVTPPNVYANAFPKPTTWVQTLDISTDADASLPLYDFVDESGYWYANPGAIVVRYISDDPARGLNVTLWPVHFRDLLAVRLAEVSAGRLGVQQGADKITERRMQAQAMAAQTEAERAARTFGTDPVTQTRLQVYNEALSRMGQPRLEALTQTNPVVRALNDQFTACVRWVLERAPWQFAARTLTVAADASAPLDGYASAIPKPVDWVKSLDLATDAALTIPLTNYSDQGRYWFCDPAAITVRFVSMDPACGLDVTLWPAAFSEAVACRLAEECCLRLTGDAARAQALKGSAQEALDRAGQTEATASARVFPISSPGITQLRVYNDALGYTGQLRIASLTDASMAVRLLNDEWALAVRWALEQGPWTFAIRAIMIGPFGDTVPTFGYQNAFKKPDDWLQTVLVSEFDDFRAGSTTYADETGWWFADAPGLFIRYVSLGPNYGMCLERWSPSFGELVATRMAEKIAPRLGMSQNAVAGLVALRQNAMKQLRATDALNTPPVFPPTGSWVQARRGGSTTGRRWGAGPGGPGQPFSGDTTLSGDSDLPVNSDFIPRISG